jgi:tRNA (guanine37-N1)-methyltransferase
MRFEVITIFPELFESFLAKGLVAKAHANGVIDVVRTNPRDFAPNKHKSVDDAPYGGGSGMVMLPGPILEALESREGEQRMHRVLLTPQGKPFTQATARRLAQLPAIALVCGRYEGVDERVRDAMDEQISLGDFVMTGGEVAAMAVIEATARLLPGVLGNLASTEDESHADGLLEYPQYTRPPAFRGQQVPEVLLSGDHAAVARWRRKEALRRTRRERPDMFAAHRPDKLDRVLLRELEAEEPQAKAAANVPGEPLPSTDDEAAARRGHAASVPELSALLAGDRDDPLSSDLSALLATARHERHDDAPALGQHDDATGRRVASSAGDKGDPHERDDDAPHVSLRAIRTPDRRQPRSDRGDALAPEPAAAADPGPGPQSAIARAPIYVGLVHHPIKDREGQIVATAVTNLDVHDLARSCRSYGLAGYFVITPIAAQRELVGKILEHWVEGSGKKRIPERAVALSLCQPIETIEAAEKMIALRHGTAPHVITTAAKLPHESAPKSAAEVRAAMRQSARPWLILFGTGHGLANEVLQRAELSLPPIRPGTYNHLSVRAACAIMLDRLFGDEGA